MNVLFSNFKKARVIFPHHVRERVLQRFKLFMSRTEQQNVELFLRKDFNHATVNFANHMSPFYVNAQDSKHGKNSFIASSKYLNYYGNYDENSQVLIIKTVYKKSDDIKQDKK